MFWIKSLYQLICSPIISFLLLFALIIDFRNTPIIVVQFEYFDAIIYIWGELFIKTIRAIINIKYSNCNCNGSTTNEIDSFFISTVYRSFPKMFHDDFLHLFLKYKMSQSLLLNFLLVIDQNNGWWLTHIEPQNDLKNRDFLN